jgi:hypothetical protein
MTPSVRAVACIALGLALACGRGSSAPKPPQPAPPTIGGRIDPAPYRSEIEATEALLYTKEPLTDDGWKDLSRSLLELHNAIVFRDNSALARETSGRIVFLSATVDAEPATHHNAEELVVMRTVWEKIRADQFASASWFRSATP